MAGYVKLFRSIWQDAEFVALSCEAQHLYLLIISQPDMTHVGVLPLTISRWARLTHAKTSVDIRNSLAELEAARFVVVDTATEELLVRSYILHDRAHLQTNGKKSLVNAYGQVLSDQLQTVLATLLATVDVTVDAPVVETVELLQYPVTTTATVDQSSSSGFDAWADRVTQAAAETLYDRRPDAVRDPFTWQRSVAQAMRTERAERLRAAYGMALEIDLAARWILGEPVTTGSERTWWPDPDCPECTDGHHSWTDDTDRYYVANCPRRLTSNPTTTDDASVIQLRRTP